MGGNKLGSGSWIRLRHSDRHDNLLDSGAAAAANGHCEAVPEAAH